MRTGPRFRATVVVGMALAATVLAAATGSRISSPATPVEADQAITAIRSGLEPAAFPAKLHPGFRISGKHREGDGGDQVALAAMATVVALALGHAVVVGRPWQGPARRVRSPWAERAPPIFQHT